MGQPETSKTVCGRGDESGTQRTPRPRPGNPPKFRFQKIREDVRLLRVYTLSTSRQGYAGQAGLRSFATRGWGRVPRPLSCDGLARDAPLRVLPHLGSKPLAHYTSLQIPTPRHMLMQAIRWAFVEKSAYCCWKGATAGLRSSAAGGWGRRPTRPRPLL